MGRQTAVAATRVDEQPKGSKPSASPVRRVLLAAVIAMVLLASTLAPAGKFLEGVMAGSVDPRPPVYDLVFTCSTIWELTQPVRLRNSADADQLVYETDDARITIGHDQFTAYWRHRLDGGPGLWPDHLIWFREPSTLPHTPGSVDLDGPTIAEMLRHGNGTVYDKKEQAELQQITLDITRSGCEPFGERETLQLFFPDGKPLLRIDASWWSPCQVGHDE